MQVIGFFPGCKQPDYLQFKVRSLGSNDSINLLAAFATKFAAQFSHEVVKNGIS
jgi:hypothetical protein